MTITHRRGIFFLFLITFLLSAPIILVYSAGYRFDWSQKKFIKTGLLLLNITPSDVTVQLNQKASQPTWREKQNLRFSHLIPREYAVDITKSGYFPWNKRLSIQSGTTTTIEPIILFQQKNPTLISKGNLEFADQLANQALYIQRQDVFDTLLRVSLTNPPSSQPIPLNIPSETSMTVKYQIQGAWFSEHGENILIKIRTEAMNSYNVISTKEPLKRWALSLFFQEPIEAAFFSSIGDHLLYILTADKIYTFNLNTSKPHIIHQRHFSQETRALPEYTMVKDILYSFLKKNDGIYLQATSLNPAKETQDEKEILHLPLNTQPNFTHKRLKHLFFVDQTTDTIFIDTGEGASFQPLKGHIVTKQEDAWGYANTFELLVWNSRENRTQFINRYSDEINHLLWYPRGRYLILSHNGKVVISETNTLDTINQYDIATFDTISHVTTNTTGNEVFIIASTGNEAGLYTISIAD